MPYRSLTPEELAQLQHNECSADDWSRVLVADGFDPRKLRGCQFFGDIRLGSMADGLLRDGDLALPVGISESLLADCTVGDNCAIHHVHALSHYSVGSRCLLFNIGDLTASAEPHMPLLDPMNENGGRRIGICRGMTVGDAYLWAKYRDRKALCARFDTITRQGAAARPLGHIGDSCVIRGCATIHNVAVESDADSPSRIVACTALDEGIVGYGCALEHGVIAQRFLLGENVKLLNGLRLTDSVVGDNSTLACGEVGCSLIFPAHEQHHNNSFLIASLVMGQSNVAAGATIGSNHNSRTADNELVARRGFWPGLCSSFKHSSKFGSYCLLAKADYPYELNIALPFALVSNNAAKNQLEVMPAYWWMYNMFALDRNARKFADRDRRVRKAQHVEFSLFAPDTAEEVVAARQLLKHWTEQAYNPALLKMLPPDQRVIEIVGQGMEHSTRKVVILKAGKAYKAYEQMLLYYAMGLLTEGGDALPDKALAEGPRQKRWENIGGQLVAADDLEALLSDAETAAGWEVLHERLDALWAAYPGQKRRHAYQILCDLLLVDDIDEGRWAELLGRYEEVKRYVAEQRFVTRDKDNTNVFRQMTYSNTDEMLAVLGPKK